MKNYYRKTATKVKDGEVQYKNNWSLTPNIFNTRPKQPVFDKERPGRGYKHLLRKNDLYLFIDLLPEWEELSIGLDAVLLAEGGYDAMGWYDNGVVAICAWERDIVWKSCTTQFYESHKNLFSKLNVECTKHGPFWEIDFDENSAKAFQLIHVFIHELGHHHDRMTTIGQRSTARGESYAEKYAAMYEDPIIDKYRFAFNYV